MVYKGEDIFIRFDRMYERDRRTPHDGIGYTYGHSYYRRRIGNCTQAFECHQFQ